LILTDQRYLWKRLPEISDRRFPIISLFLLFNCHEEI